MAQKYLRRWTFVKGIGIYLCKKILKTAIFHHARWSVHTDTYTTWDKEFYAASAVCARRHDGRHQEQHQSMVRLLYTSHVDCRRLARNSQFHF
jgi:hypothetical protein